MIIETADKAYIVIGHLEHSEARDIYLCENTGDKSRYCVVKFNNSYIHKDFVEFLYAQVENRSFSDLVECFIFEENFHLVFRYYQGTSILDILNSYTLGLRERMEIEKKILEKTVLLEMPYFFQNSCLKPENIFIQRNLEVSFKYSVDGLENRQSYSMENVQDRVAKLTEILFKNELKIQVAEPVKEFIDSLSSESYESYFDIYEHFLKVYMQLLGMSENELTIPKTWSFKLWDKIKASFPYIRRAGALLLLTVGLIYLVWTVKDKMEPASRITVVTQIGTEPVN